MKMTNERHFNRSDQHKRGHSQVRVCAEGNLHPHVFRQEVAALPVLRHARLAGRHLRHSHVRR